MENSIEELFKKATEKEKDNTAVAVELYENIINIFNACSFYQSNCEVIKIFAMANANLFLLSNMERVENAYVSIKYFENYLGNNYYDAQAQNIYLTMLEFTYQYKKAYKMLLELLQHEKLEKLALSFLTSLSYVCEGLMPHKDWIIYKKRLIELETDENKKKELIAQLEYIEKL